MRMLILLAVLLTLVGCGNPTPKITPNELPTAISGVEYSSVIKISGGYISKKSISIEIIPDKSGLLWRPEVSYRNSLGKVQKDEDFHTIMVSGIPLIKGIIQIKIGGYTHGTMYVGKEFNKTYNIIVE